MKNALHKWTALALLVVILMASTPASAANRRKAMKLANQAATAFSEQRYEDAADLLSQAYQHYPEPNFIWNTARAYELAHIHDLAELNYLRYSELDLGEEARQAVQNKLTRYNATRDLPDLLKNTQDMAELLTLQEAYKAQRNAPPPSEPPAAPSSSPNLLVWTGWTCAGLGGLALGAAGALHLASVDTVEQYHDAANGPDRARYDALRDTVQTRVTTSQVLLGSGVVLGAIGGTLLYLELSENTETEPAQTLRLSPLLQSDQAGLGLSGTF